MFARKVRTVYFMYKFSKNFSFAITSTLKKQKGGRLFALRNPPTIAKQKKGRNIK